MTTSLILLAIIIILVIVLITLIIRHQKTTFQQQNQFQLSEQQATLLLHEKQQWLQKQQNYEQYLSQHQQQAITLHSELASAHQKIKEQEIWFHKLQQTEQDLQTLRQQHSQQQVDLKEALTRLEESRLSAEEKQRLLVQSEHRLTEQFENLANRIFEQNGRKIDEQNRQSIHHILSPLREQLEGFKKQVQDSFGQEAKERHTLAFEIRSLKALNEQMTLEASNLTKALKGDNKTQGNWGEVVLSRVLEASGLREGYEYDTQVSIKNEQGARQQPDVIVHLPQNKDVIIDAKMTLTAYERYFSSDNAQIRQQSLSAHLQAVRNHIRLLSKKDYQLLPTVRSLDYVLMFIPVEPAFLLAIEHEPNLINEALQNNIMLVSPTTLLVALRTIHNLWRYEYQNQNAQKIADRATKLYDKFRLFIDDMEGLGHILTKTQATYKDAMKKLVEGRGNIVTQIEHFRELGIQVKKPISSNITEQAKVADSPLLNDEEEVEPLHNSHPFATE